MARVRYRFFRTRGVYANYDAFRRVVAEGHQKELFPLVERAAQGITSNWKVDVRWLQTIDITQRGIAHDMFPDPESPGGRIWRWVSGGVAGHLIVAKKNRTFRGVGNYKPTLKLRRYRPYTAPGGFWGGPGSYYGPTGYRQAVYWPGIAPRNFEAQLGKQLAPEYIKLTEKWVRRGVKAAQREGR